MLRQIMSNSLKHQLSEDVETKVEACERRNAVNLIEWRIS